MTRIFTRTGNTKPQIPTQLQIYIYTHTHKHVEESQVHKRAFTHAGSTLPQMAEETYTHILAMWYFGGTGTSIFGEPPFLKVIQLLENPGENVKRDVASNYQ